MAECTRSAYRVPAAWAVPDGCLAERGVIEMGPLLGPEIGRSADRPDWREQVRDAWRRVPGGVGGGRETVGDTGWRFKYHGGRGTWRRLCGREAALRLPTIPRQNGVA